jgi:hypothetical protein
MDNALQQVAAMGKADDPVFNTASVCSACTIIGNRKEKEAEKHADVCIVLPIKT